MHITLFVTYAAICNCLVPICRANILIILLKILQFRKNEGVSFNYIDDLSDLCAEVLV